MMIINLFSITQVLSPVGLTVPIRIRFIQKKQDKFSMYREFNSGYVNNNEISRNIYEGNYIDLSEKASSPGRYKPSRLENLGDYKIISGEKINLNAPAYSSV